MASQALEQDIFRTGSTTYYWGSRFFPKDVRADVFKLYSFLRVADDYVDQVPAQPERFFALRKEWDRRKADLGFETDPLPADTVDERVIKNIVDVSRRYAFDMAWVEAFWSSMQADLEGRKYQTLEDSLWYVYGSAEVVGLMMAKIMNLDPEAYVFAKMQGRAMQWVNFIRDLQEDNQLERQYFPVEDLEACSLKGLDEAAARQNPAAFRRFMRLELQRYQDWQDEARKGLFYIPGLLRPALAAATDMYDWTATQIAKNPFVVFERKIKPTKRQVLAAGLRHAVMRPRLR